jgi:hypothetical protein
MSPVLSEILPDEGQYKYVRKDRRIAYGPMEMDHSQIARLDKVGIDTGKKDGANQVKVDDAGTFLLIHGTYMVGGISMTCDYIGGDPRAPKEETMKIFKDQTNRPVTEF